MKKHYILTRRFKALLWITGLLLSLLLYLLVSGYCLTPTATLRQTEERWLYAPLEKAAYFTPFRFNSQRYYPMLAENEDTLLIRLCWFSPSTGWQSGDGSSVSVSDHQNSVGGSVDTSYITAINDHRAFFYGRINDPSAVRWELESRVSYSPHWIDNPVPESTLLDVPITEQWVETDDARYFFFTIDTHAVWQQLGDQYNYNTLMHLYDADGKLLDTIDLGEQWTAYREE